MSKYSVAIIGCGSIGSSKPDEYDKPGGDAVLTHAHAFSRHPQTELRGLIDADLDRTFTASKKWKVDRLIASGSVNALRNIDIDIIVVATPTATHRDVLMQALALKPRLVVAEKPFCQTLEEAREVHDAYAAAGIPVLVDYIRRFDAVIAATLADIRGGQYGRVQYARCLYGRGLKRDGCHGLDAFNQVFGQPTGMFIDHHAIDDGEPGDASYNVHLEYEGCREVHMVAADSRMWGAFELEFVCEAGVVALVDWGKAVVVRRAAAEETYGQYKALRWPAQLVEKTGLTTALLHLADNCVRHLRAGEPLACTSADAIRVHEILKHVKELK